MKQCEKCRGWIYIDDRACTCVLFAYRVVGIHGLDWDEAYARDAAGLAERLAEDDFDTDPMDPHRFEFQVDVKDQAGKVTRFEVDAEARVDFNATEIEIPAEVTP